MCPRSLCIHYTISQHPHKNIPVAVCQPHVAVKIGSSAGVGLFLLHWLDIIEETHWDLCAGG